MQQAYVPFEGEKSTWHDGFERYDFVMDGDTMAITPFKRPEKENFGIGAPPAGGRRCVVICPKQAAPGNPWSWRGCYWDHQPQTEVELLRRGFHVAYISADASLKPDKYWEAWYAFLTEKHGLSKKPVFVGMSRGGEYSFMWATQHPDKVSALYSDNPGSNEENMRRLPEMAKNDVPILLVCGTIDPLLLRFATTIETNYQQLGGRVSMMLKEGAGHHPHSLNDPKPMADFLERSVQEKAPPVPDFVAGNRFNRYSYYSQESSYAKYPRDGYYITSRGPAFTECYNRYEVTMGLENPVNIIAPRQEAPGKPWVFRAGYVARDAKIDQALLAKGFHIVVGPVGYNADGPNPADWDKLYKHLTDHGFSKKPVMEGAGGAAGAVYAWAIENPDKVSCIYAENPILHTGNVKIQPLDNLAPLAKAGVPILHVCGSLDPALNEQTRVAEKRYKEMNGTLTVILQEGEGHYPTAPKDPKPVLDFIMSHQ
ncbi:MAG: Alpha/beta hydrolase family protein [Chthonomonadales bacterium]|nr:Alpha/beta hydrolase family protein [Chthonomonadales bacterium]